MDPNNPITNMEDEEFVYFYIELGTALEEDDFDIYEEYLIRTEKEFNGDRFDKDMIQILKEFDRISITHDIMRVRKQFRNYLVFYRGLMYESVSIDIKGYKLNLITKILSSERDNNESINLIENIVFANYDTKIECANNIL